MNTAIEGGGPSGRDFGHVVWASTDQECRKLRACNRLKRIGVHNSPGALRSAQVGLTIVSRDVSNEQRSVDMDDCRKTNTKQVVRTDFGGCY